MKSVHDLTREEFAELKSTYFFNFLGEKEFESIEEVIEEDVVAYYEGTAFSDDDFWCNQQVIE